MSICRYVNQLCFSPKLLITVTRKSSTSIKLSRLPFTLLSNLKEYKHGISRYLRGGHHFRYSQQYHSYYTDDCENRAPFVIVRNNLLIFHFIFSCSLYRTHILMYSYKKARTCFCMCYDYTMIRQCK